MDREVNYPEPLNRAWIDKLYNLLDELPDDDTYLEQIVLTVKQRENYHDMSTITLDGKGHVEIRKEHHKYEFYAEPKKRDPFNLGAIEW